MLWDSGTLESQEAHWALNGAAPHLGKSTNASIPTARPAAIVPTLGKQRARFPNPAARRRPLPAKAAGAHGREYKVKEGQIQHPYKAPHFRQGGAFPLELAPLWPPYLVQTLLTPLAVFT